MRLPEFDGEVSPELVKDLLEQAAGEQDQLPLLQHLLMLVVGYGQSG